MLKITLVALLFVGMTVVYAEEATIQVPFESHGLSCTFNEIAVEYHCIWQGNPPTPMSIEEIEEFKDIIHDRVIDEAIAKLEAKALEEIAIQQAILTPTEKLIQNLEEKYAKGNLRSNEIEYLKLLKALDQCYNGVGKSRQIQEFRAFDTSNAQTSLLQGHEFKGEFGKLAKAIEECKAQSILENSILNAKYDNLIGSEVLQLHHRDFVGDTVAIPFDSFRENNRSIDLSQICDNYQFSDQHKEQFGCPQEAYEGEYKNSDGYIEYESEILGKYWEFRNSNE